MRTSVKKWGNSASIRIPSAVLDESNLKIDDPVDIRSEGGRIIIEPARAKSYNIDDLVAGITDDNRHGEVDFGLAVGNEVW